MSLKTLPAQLKNLFTKRMHKLAFRLLEPMDRWAFRPYYRSPLAVRPHKDTDDYLQRWAEVKQQSHPEIVTFVQKTGFAIDEEWFQDLMLLTRMRVTPNPPVASEHGRILYSTLSAYVAEREFESVNILETGTHLGFSALCLAKALQDQQQPGKIITMDLIPHDVKMYWNSIADEQGPQTRLELLRDYQDLLDQYLIFLQGDTRLQMKKLQLSRVHYAALDGAHTYEDIHLEVASLQNKQQPGDMIFFDDYTLTQFPEVVKAIDEVCEKYQYSQEVLKCSEGPDKGYVVAVKL